VKVLEGPWSDWPEADRGSSVTIGVLDGVHLGHMALLARLDPSMNRTALTFDPHPIEVLRPGSPPRLITTIEERIRLLTEVGVDCVGVLDLGAIKEQAPEHFVEGVLVDKLRVGHLVVGEDFRFGKDRAGDVSLLESLGERLGFEVDTIALVRDDGGPVSSSRIRDLIETGRVTAAGHLLGRWFSLTNEVVAGDKRGREIGFRTANLEPPGRKVVPGDGVYSCFAEIEGTRHDAAVNVGVRPTFGGGDRLIEAFLLDFNEDIYGRAMTLEFVAHMRPELEFPGVDELVSQIEEDVSATREILERARSGM